MKQTTYFSAQNESAGSDITEAAHEKSNQHLAVPSCHGMATG